MKKHLFLTGASGLGKSELIREVLGPYLAMAGGFVTEKAVGPDGRVIGHDLLPAAAAGGVQGFEPLRFMDCTSPAPRTDNEVFRVSAAQLLREAAYYPFSVLDAFGGFELVIPPFREALADFLSSEQPCIGVLLPLAEVERLRQSLGLGEKLTAYAARLHEALRQDSDTVILNVRSRNDEVARRIVRQWAKEFT